METKTGIKTLNAGAFRLGEGWDCGERVMLSASQLFLGPDMLNDNYTLLDKCITDSPFIEFMSLLNNGKDVSRCDYFIRTTKGCLDGRVPELPNINRMKSRFKQQKVSITNDDYSPVKVYQIKGKYYIKDGKHRAALCALLQRPVVCEDVSRTYQLSCISLYTYKYFVFRKPIYSKHKEFYNRFTNRNEQ